MKCCKDTSRQDDGKGFPSPNSQENDQQNVQIGSTHKKLGIDAWKNSTNWTRLMEPIENGYEMCS